MWLSSDMLNSLVYWENPRDSGIAFGPVLVCLLACRYISLISVLGNLALALVTATVSFRWRYIDVLFKFIRELIDI